MLRETLFGCVVFCGLLAGCASDAEVGHSGDGNDEVVTEDTIVFSAPKAAQDKDASKPKGSAKGKKEGDTITISYAPQRIRGCDGGGWAQSTEVRFIDKAGNTVGDEVRRSGFSGVGMVPKEKESLEVTVTVPKGAEKLVVISTNDGEPHDPSDAADTAHTGDNGKDFNCQDPLDGKGWTLDL